MAAEGMTVTIDSSKLNAAIQERIKVNGSMVRTFAQIVNQSLFSVALNAQKYTPKADPARIDVSMNVSVNYIENKAGKKVPARKPHTFSYGPGTHVTTVPLAKLIVLARADISKQGRETGRSNYNVLTNDRWRLPKDALKGGNAKILEMMHAMTMARHSSSALLKAGWKPAMDILRPLLARNAIAGGTAGEHFAHTGEDPMRLGTAVPAKEGWVCEGMIENHVGGGGSALDARQRKALLEFGTEPAERALSEEEAKMMAYVRKWVDEDAAKFNQEMR